ncbi:MAG: tetratricopeptide repeat protein [Armatimonadetes bacterium]|nr:tetratricopeptide repeat protein [Armatimonadota bacterium]
MLQTFEFEGALDQCQAVLEIDPDHLGALEVMAQAQWQAGQFEEVITTTSRLLRLNPHEPGYRYTRGMALMSRGELFRAAEDFKRAISQSDDMRFKTQVAGALDAVEMWIEEQSLRPRREENAKHFPRPKLQSDLVGRYH